MKTHKGYIQTSFEHKTGVPLRDWLLEHGPTMTLQAAADEIGYSGSHSLKEWADRHLPADFKFYERPPLFSLDELEVAIVRHDAGESWRLIALDYGRDLRLLKDACRRHLQVQRKGIKDDYIAFLTLLSENINTNGPRSLAAMIDEKLEELKNGKRD